MLTVWLRSDLTFKSYKVTFVTWRRTMLLQFFSKVVAYFPRLLEITIPHTANKLQRVLNCPCGRRHQQVWSWFVAASPLATTLAWRFRTSRVQAWHHDVFMVKRLITCHSKHCLSISDVTSRQRLWPVSRRLLVVPRDTCWVCLTYVPVWLVRRSGTSCLTFLRSPDISRERQLSASFEEHLFST